MSIQLVPSSQLSFKRPLTHASRETLLVINTGNEPIMFKVKTTAPKQYTVTPNSGRIEPQSQVEVQVMLQAFKQEPPFDHKCKDKFLVQCAAIKPVYEALPISEMWGITELEDRESIHQQKLKVVFSPPISTLSEEQEEPKVIDNHPPVVEPVVHHQDAPNVVKEHISTAPLVEEQLQQQQQQVQDYHHEEPTPRNVERSAPPTHVEVEETTKESKVEEEEDTEKKRLQQELAAMTDLIIKLKTDLSTMQQDKASTPATEKTHHNLTAFETPQAIEGYTPQMVLTIAALVFVFTYLFF